MADFSFPQWTGRNHADVENLSAKLEDTPVRKQPACFRVGTPFPLPAAVGVVQAVGKNATETGCALPPLRPQSSASNHQTVTLTAWTNKTDLFKVPPPLHLEAEGKLTGSDGQRCSNESSLLDSLIGDRIPCRESMARLSLSEEAAEKPSIDDKQTITMAPSIEKATVKPIRIDENERRSLSDALEEIEKLKDVIRTLEFRRDEYKADDGALGMASFLESLEKEKSSEIDRLKTKLKEERRKRISYQNRCREALAKMTDLEVRLVQQTRRSTIDSDPSGSPSDRTIDDQSPTREDGNKRRWTVGSGSKKKLKA